MRRLRRAGDPHIDGLEVSVFNIPTETQPESDGTAVWDHTTLVVVELSCGGKRGLGYTYADQAAGRFILEVLKEPVVGADPMAVPALAAELMRRVRNHGREGVAAMAISAVDLAAWDLKAKLLGVPLVQLLGASRDRAAIYGSGGFTSYSIPELERHLAHWVELGIPRVKMKVGREPDADPRRVAAARGAVGQQVELFVDGNGAYDRKRALRLAEMYAELKVRWFEEPVSSDDLEGLRLLRDRAPALMDVTAGEYAYHPLYVRRMLEAGAVDVMMVDVTRCLGVSGFMSAASICDAYAIPLSAHCAPCASLHVCLSAPRFRHMEYFYDHQRIERMLFDGAPSPVEGFLEPDWSRPGLGIELKRRDAEKFAV